MQTAVVAAPDLMVIISARNAEMELHQTGLKAAKRVQTIKQR